MKVPLAVRTLPAITPESLLTAAAAAQTIYWDALAALERALGFEIEPTELGELNAYKVDDIRARYGKIDPTTAARHYLDKEDDPGHGAGSACEVCRFHQENG